MTCDEWRLEISAWEDGELEEPEEPALFGHLAACDACRLFTRRVRTVRQMLARGRISGSNSGENEENTAHPGRKAVGFGAMIILTAIVASFIGLVILLSVPHRSESITGKGPAGDAYRYELPDRFTGGGRR
jgi:predicted anti-sigma-YlaC factor YlaD